MKKVLTLVFVLFSIFICQSQSIQMDETDEFLGTKKLGTSWEVLTKNLSFSAFYRLVKLDEQYYFDLKMMKGMADYFTIDEGDEVMLKLANDDVLEFPNIEYATACEGCGARGFAGSMGLGVNTKFRIERSEIQKLSKHHVQKVRIYTTKGYFENKVSGKNARTLQNCAKLIKPNEDQQ